MAKNIATFGIYPNRESLSEGLERARESGFRSADISALLPENTGSKEFAHAKSTKAPEGVTIGAASGALIGGAAGWLIAAGALSIPGAAPMLAAGPIIGTLAGVGVGGSIGGILGGLIGAGFLEYEAKRYQGRLRSNGILVSLHCDNPQWVKKAKHVLAQTGAADISAAAEESADFAVSDKPWRRRADVSIDESRKHGLGREPAVRDVMNRDVASVTTDATLGAASAIMREQGVTFLVVRSGDDVEGIVTDRELLRAIGADQNPNETTVHVAMSREYPYCYEVQSQAAAERIMADWNSRHVLVLNEKRRVVGVLEAVRSGQMI